MIALCWSLFQLSLASWLLLDSTYIRAIHLAFAFLIVFLSYPTLRRDVRIPGLRWLGEKQKIPPADMILAVLAALSALYIVLDYEGIAGRVGMPNGRDMLFGALLILLLLEATRRVIGPALPLIAVFFTLYAFFGPYMPDFLAFKGVSLDPLCQPDRPDHRGDLTASPSMSRPASSFSSSSSAPCWRRPAPAGSSSIWP